MRHRPHLPFYVAAAAAALAALPVGLSFAPGLAITISANVFFLAYLALTALKLRRLTPAVLKHNAGGADEPVAVIFAVTLGAVVVAVGSLFVVINRAGEPGLAPLALALGSVAFGWLTIHTMAAMHYAHLYWMPSRITQGGHSGGLDFPGDDEPGGTDFLYFAFVIGMTAQTSDVAITSTRMRRLNLLHALVSFLFNTVLVAAAVNLAVSLGN